MAERFVGLDLSLNGTGVAILERANDSWSLPVCTTIRISPPSPVTKTFEAQRLVYVINRLLRHEVFDPTKVKMAAVEDYAFGVGGPDSNGNSKSNCTFSLGEIGGCVRFHLCASKVSYLNVPILLGKKFATGNGAARKDQVAKCMAELWGIQAFNKQQFDASDALGMATLAAYKFYGGLPDKVEYKYWKEIADRLEVVIDREIS